MSEPAAERYGAPVWGVSRPAPWFTVALLGAGLPLAGVAWITMVLFAFEWSHQVDRALGPLSPGRVGVALSSVVATVGTITAVVWGLAAWSRRRWGDCAAHERGLVFGPALAFGARWGVDLADVEGWDVTPHGVLVRAPRDVLLRNGQARRRGLLMRALFPLLIPASDAADVARAEAYLAGRERAP